MQTILITGANGFVSYYLIQQLLQKNFKVVATGKGNSRLPFSGNNFVYTSMDFTNDADVENIFEKYKPAVVVHTGAISKPDECEQNKEAAFLTNVTGTINLLYHSAKYKSHFIFLSTDFIFSGNEGMYKEEDIAAPVNYYGQTKLLAEEEVKKYTNAWSIVRTVLVYGNPKGGRDNILTVVAKHLKEGKTYNVFNDQVRTPTYVEDLATAIVTIIEKQKEGVYHISGEDVRTPYEMAVEVAEYLGLDKSLINKVTATTFTQPAKRPLKTGFNISKAKKELNYNPVAFKEGLRKSLEG